MKKRIVSMILALSMVLSILPVSAFADAGAGFSSAAAEETNSITYSSEEEHEAVGKNSETNNQVVKIEVGTNGLPKAASGTGWSYDETTGLTITGTGSEDTEYILDGTVSCNVTVKNANSHTVYLLDGTVTGTLLIEADNMYGVRVLGGSYADVQLNLGTIDGGTYDKLTENGGNVRGGFFRDISGLSADTQQQAHQLLLPENCTLNGQKETKIYIIKKYNYSGNGNDLELVVESDTGCDVLIVHNLRLVVYIAKKFESKTASVEDMISIGTIGLIKAVNTFVPSKNIKLATYASRCIENEILMYLRKSSNKRQESSIDEPLNTDCDGNELLLSDVLGTDGNQVGADLEQAAEKNMLLEAVGRLSARERQIMELRFGLSGGAEHTQKEVADMIGISQSYISRLEKRIIKRLKGDLERIS